MNAETQEPTATPVELTQLVVGGARALNRRIHLIGTEEGAAEIAALARGLITAAQELLGVAEHVAAAEVTAEEPAPLGGAWAAATEGRTYGFNPDVAERDLPARHQT